jgi:Domain of unknown function (DUF4907)
MLTTPWKNKKKRLVIVISSALGFLVILYFAIHTIFPGNYQESIFPSHNGWGYEIANSHRVIIRQEFIQSIPGQMPFASKRDAKKTADLVIRKLEEGKLPTISKRELELLKVKITESK